MLKKSDIIFGVVSTLICVSTLCNASLPDARPSLEKRTFQSPAIENLISTLTPLFVNPDMAMLFSNCLPNTLDTTVSFHSPQGSTPLDSFIITGDIDALWLRDSGNQVVPYLPYGPSDPALQSLFEGLIARHANSVLIDPFANSFNFNASGDGHQSDRRTPAMTRAVFEGKYEIDSLAAFLKLSYWHWRFSGDEALVRFATDKWLSAVDKLLDTVQTMQRDTGKAPSPPYKFQRDTTEALDTLMMQGRGPPARPNGFTRSLFRPSDDAVTLPYNIPGLLA
jgi:meiotically up-regulated gene 157 (Mug157) protein